ncbi:fimbria/pilus outer membrane usher protein [Ignatzschineria rhizosphaerae]|uniref:Fimbria/pilus outer membrane usher protein n=1 Tax=Ignatzschineria rhizosphaerae TaxID=2923279 RepID=A0ABY3X3I4_9GAMM|nr:fimbria/pilus outer membrane usher protein [Ignatzschineria rhizosphaerae]UNM97453.1 fimbria/pilus outer membrane usher protein [Ignatzschineria rhizosphaerae]
MLYGSRYKQVDHQVTYRGQGLGGNYSIGGSLNHQRDLSGSMDHRLNATYNANTGYGQFMMMADYSDYRKGLRTSFDSSLTLTQHGIATHERVYGDGSRLILDADAPGIPVQGGRSVSNTFGLIGLGNTSSYYRGSYAVDNDNLPEDVEIQDGIIEVAMSDGAIAYRSLNGVSGGKAVARISLADGSYPPFGAIVYRKNGNEQEIAIVAEEGLTYLTGLNNHAEFLIKWNGSKSCQLKINSIDANELNNLICY